MPVETPKPTLEELWAIRRNRIGCAPAVLLEVQRRLRESLPDYIDHLNDNAGWNGRHNGLIPVPKKSIRLAPAFLDASCKNSILITLAGGTSSLAGRVLGQNGSLTIMSIEDVFETDEQILRSLDRAEAVATILSAFLTGVNNDQNVTVWKKMKFAGVNPLPPELANGYAGAMASFEIEQTPHANGLAMTP